MTKDTRFRYAGPGVVHENFEDETVIVNLGNGAYYSLNAAGRCLWMMVGAGMSISDIAKAAGRDGGSPDRIEAFLEELRSEGLILPTTESTSTPVSIPPGIHLDDAAPKMEKFTDMERLILLDVIHDVDATGWPILAGDDKAPGT